MSNRMVVVIEDDTVLRLQAVELFELVGLDVESFENGEEAIDFVRRHEDRVTCVFTDIKLGGATDGLEVARLVSEALPDVAVVLTSGQLLDRPPGLRGNIRFLPKPWQPYDIINAVQDAELDDG